MSSIRSDRVALDTNVLIHALRRSTGKEDCAELLFSRLSELHVYILLQVQAELRRNLSDERIRELFEVVRSARGVEWGNDLPTKIR
jgi:hypothetical protein